MKRKSAIFSTIILICSVCAFVFWQGCGKDAPITHKADYDVIIIGGGMGGLSAATHLAVNNFKVLLLEQHDKVGGCATRFERGDFTFEASLHEMAGGGPGKKDRGLYQLLKAAGVDKKVEFIELPHFYRSIFPGVDITLPNNWEGFKRVLKEKWPEESEGIDEFQMLCSTVFEEILSIKDLFRYKGLKALAVKALVPLRQRTFFKWSGKTVQELLDHCFKNEDIKAVVSQLWVYYGAPVPEQAALIYLAATEVFMTDGIWHFKGTSQELSNAYAERIKELGGEVKTDTLVTKIIMENGIARGVKTASGDTYTARYVVANTDPYQLTNKLIGKEHFPDSYIKKLKDLKPANSLFGVYMGLNIDLKKAGYDDTEIFYNPTKDTVVLHDNMMKGDFKNGSVVLTIYSNYGDPIYAPKGKSVVVLVSYSDYSIWPEDESAYYKLKDEKVDELIKLASNAIPELADPKNIEVKEGFTPRTLKRYTMNKGGIVYGFYLSPKQLMKIPNDTPIRNVFIASNWSQAWHGVGSTQINGWRAARLIMDIEGME
ncbi:MAG: NAD(P)/FAD-dependent oxidoreductase [Deltaproteobacteria bacterium]|nr:NAD(P)/FAD-dependent oxidoreductase [Deltaproteobacteria bacterium]